MAGAWGCPHERNDVCTKVNNLPCNPGMKGCVLAGRYVFFNDDAKNERLRAKRAIEAAQVKSEPSTETESAIDALSTFAQEPESVRQDEQDV